MSDENIRYSPRYSSFWPMFILMSGIFIWCAYQLYAINSQRVVIDQQYEALAATVEPAEGAQKRLFSLAQDLVQMSAKDPNATQIVKESIQAGILHFNKNSTGTNTTTTPAAPPAPAPSK